MLTFKEFKNLFKLGNLVALYKTIPADLETPVSAFMKIAGQEPDAFLLESAEQEERVGRYSILGYAPEAVFTASGNEIRIERKDQIQMVTSRMVDLLENEMAGQKLANPDDVEGFSGGLVGFFGYDCVTDFESVRFREKKGAGTPDSVFFHARRFLIFDHFRKSIKIVVMVRKSAAESLAGLYADALKKIGDCEKRILEPVKKPRGQKRPAGCRLTAHMKPLAFQKKVLRIREYIKAGDCIQVVLSQKFSAKAPKDDFSVYRALRSINPSPYMFYFRSRQFRLIGSSPELLVKIHGKTCEVRPIAGTRPRGENPPRDLALEEQLKKSPKELAEHLMLVDLGRNDLGRVCDFRSVQVKQFARVERYSHVMHLVSDVTGILSGGKTRFDLLKATFPAGTVSGAPKIRAMQIIDELEEEKRGPYAGCVGFFSYGHSMEMCITIRTLWVAGGKIFVQAGAGIVKDSNPAREYQETVNKAQALFKAIERSGEFSCC